MTKVIFLVSINKIIYEQKKGLLTIIRSFQNYILIISTNYVFCFFFLAAGNKTLFKIKR